MAKLQNYNGRYCEWEFEYTFLSYLEEEGWQYLPGGSIPRSSQMDVLYLDDMEQFLCKTNPDLTAEDIRRIMELIKRVGADSPFATLHKVYGWMVNGLQFTPQSGLVAALIYWEITKEAKIEALYRDIDLAEKKNRFRKRRPDQEQEPAEQA